MTITNQIERLEKDAIAALGVVKAFRLNRGPNFKSAQAAVDTINRYIRLRSQIAKAERLRLIGLRLGAKL